MQALPVSPRSHSLSAALPARASAVVSALVALAFAGEARGDLPPIEASIHGGNVDVGGRGALSVAMGWPSIYVRYDVPTRGSFGLAFQGDFYYGRPVFGFDFGLGTGFSVPMRIQVLDRERWTLAVYVKPGFYMGFGSNWYLGYHATECDVLWGDRWWGDAFFFGVELEPGVRAGFAATPFLNVFFGASTPIHILLAFPEGAGTLVEPFVPILLTGGVELALSRSVNLFGQMTVGPAFGSSVHCARCDRTGCTRWQRNTAVGFTGKMYFGFSFLF